MSFRIQETGSASPSIQIFYGRKYFLKCWRANACTPWDLGLKYEVKMYTKIQDKIIDKYPYAPFVRYMDTDVKTAGEILAMIEKYLRQPVDKEWFYGALAVLYIPEIGRFRNAKNAGIVPSRQECITIFRGSKHLPEVQQLPNLLLTYTQTYDCGNCCSYYDIITAGNDQQIAWGLVNIVNGIFRLHTNGMVHNDLHAKNILINKDLSTVQIFDYDRGYFFDKPNSLITLRDLHKISQGNVIKKYPTDFYKILWYIAKFSRVNIIFTLLNITDNNHQQFVIHYFIKYGNHFCYNNGNYRNCSESALLSDTEKDTQILREILGSNIGVIQQKIRQNFLKTYGKSNTQFFAQRMALLDQQEDKKVSSMALVRDAQQAQKFAEEIEDIEMKQANIITEPILELSLGANEGRYDESFLDRLSKVPRYTKNPCGATKNYQWAEMKSSLLVQEIIHDDSMQAILARFMRKLLERSFTILGLDMKIELDKYLVELRMNIATGKSSQKDKYRRYPVAQSPAWLNDPDGLLNNFYGLYNFMYWTWSNFIQNKYASITSCNPVALTYYLILQIVQQRINMFFDMVRGQRLGKYGGVVSDTIGITNIEIPELKRQVKGKSNYRVEPWLHPGRVQCGVPYRGKYGQYIKEYTEKNSFYASLQCSISGSVQFLIFMYLISISKDGAKKPEQDSWNIIVAAMLALVGDGGHNIREVITGIMVSSIFLSNFVGDLTRELQKALNNRNTLQQNAELVKQYRVPNILPSMGNLLGKLYNFVGKKITDLGCFTRGLHDKMFANIVSNCAKWEPFLRKFYTNTLGLNMIGVFTPDLNSIDPRILRNYDQSWQNIKEKVYDVMFSDDYSERLHKLSSYNSVQIFLGLDGRRFSLNPETSFKTAGDTTIKNIILKYPTGKNVLSRVDAKLQKYLQGCRTGYAAQKVPFAMKKKRKGNIRPIFSDEKTVVYNITGNSHPHFDPNAPEEIIRRFVNLVKKGKKKGKFGFVKTVTFGATRVLKPHNILRKDISLKKLPDIRPKKSKIPSYDSIADILKGKEKFEYESKKPYKGPLFFRKGEKGYTDVRYTYNFETKFLAVFI